MGKNRNTIPESAFIGFSAIFMLIALTQLSIADGLVFGLPENGIKATFLANTKSTTTLRLPDHIKPEMLVGAAKEMLKPQEHDFSYEVCIASVGTEMISGIPCRWLQIQQGEAVILEVLVPEDLCAPGFDTLSGSVRTLFNWKDVDRAAGEMVSPPGFDRIRYELERCRPLFPGPLKNQKELQSETVETEAGVFMNCPVITGTDSFEGALLSNGYWKVNSTFKIWLHDEAPFGVVKVSFQSQSTEYSENALVDVEMEGELLLAKVGRKATRCLPEAQEGEHGGNIKHDPRGGD